MSIVGPGFTDDASFRATERTEIGDHVIVDGYRDLDDRSGDESVAWLKPLTDRGQKSHDLIHHPWVVSFGYGRLSSHLPVDEQSTE